ncbi:uncharacterized protein LOC122645400 [Telopea speciosissima]|uniref:uncharacterized protein LOC122645400 n=1 Tax=Telopea speciosissima TaxID=54955 RepID=UPI001CC625AB|nr:uncharacterized protein LOC122645400 [Telopea speciosissima]
MGSPQIVCSSFDLPIDRSLDVSECALLSKEFSRKETKGVVFSADDDSTLGTDGFGVYFFKKTWSIIGDDICRAIWDFFDNLNLLDQLKLSRLTLVPKGVTQSTFSDFRPIVVSSLVYRFIFKLLANRMKLVINKLVDYNQSAFVEGRYIAENVLLCQELLNGYHISADDLFVFGKATVANANELVRLLSDFSKQSGLTVNSGKSSILFANTPLEVQVFFESATGIAAGSLPIRYLGVPLASKRLKSSHFLGLITKVQDKIGSWSSKFLSFAGRPALIQSVLMGTINYWLSVFRLPCGTIATLEKMMAKFLWKGCSDVGSYKVSWLAACCPKDEGGLGWLRRHSIWSLPVPALCSSTFREILHTRDVAVGCVRHLIKDSDGTLVWADPWLPAGPLGVQCILLAEALGRSLFDRVGMLLVSGNSWVNPNDDPVISNRWEEIVGTKVHSHLQEDLVIWTPSANGLFTLRSAWDAVRTRSDKLAWCNLVWFPSSQPRFSFITWLACLGRLTTRWLLAQWGMLVDTSCVLCRNGVDCLDHLLFQCAFSAVVWKDILSLNGFRREPMCSWQEELQWLGTHSSGDSIPSRIRRFSFTSTVYRLWQERNSRLFSSCSNYEKSVIQRIITDTQGAFSNCPKVCMDSMWNRSFFRDWGINVSLVHPKVSYHVWSPPPLGWVAINCDGSVKQDRGGYDAIGRDHLGNPLFAIAGGAREVSIVHMELQAIKIGLLKASSSNLSRVQVRSDSILAIKMIVGTFALSWEVRWLIENIRILHESFVSCSFAHQVREANSCADYLAGLVDTCVEFSFSMDSLTSALSVMIQNDARGKKYPNCNQFISVI